MCENDPQISTYGFTFTRLSAIEEIVQLPCTIDVIGVVLEVGETGTINLRDGGTREKRVIKIGDESRLSIDVTLWGNTLCEAFNFEEGQVIVFRSCRVSEYMGKSLNASRDVDDVIIDLVTKHPRVKQLKKWMSNQKVSKVRDQARSLTGTMEIRTPTLLLREVHEHC